VEQRRCGFGKFSDGSKGHQALQNRLACLKEFVVPWLDQELNDDKIRIMIKKSFLTIIYLITDLPFLTLNYCYSKFFSKEKEKSIQNKSCQSIKADHLPFPV